MIVDTCLCVFVVYVVIVVIVGHRECSLRRHVADTLLVQLVPRMLFKRDVTP
jgi:hypothetical protein